MHVVRRIVFAFVLATGVLGAASVPAAENGASGRLSMVDGKPVFQAPDAWQRVSAWKENSTQYAEYRFPLRAASGKLALARLSLRVLARSVRYADLSPEEGKALEHLSDAVIQETMREVENMPGMAFEAGGSQLIYTARDSGARYHYVQFISIKGVAAPDSDLAPAVAVGLRCRSAVDETAPEHEAAAEELEQRCYDLLADMGGVEGGTASGAGSEEEASSQ